MKCPTIATKTQSQNFFFQSVVYFLLFVCVELSKIEKKKEGAQLIYLDRNFQIRSIMHKKSEFVKKITKYCANYVKL